MSLIESRDILTKLCSNDYYRGDDIQCAIQCLAEGKTIKRVRTLEDVGMTVIDEKLKDELMKVKDSKSAFDDVNPKWLSLLLTFLSTDPPRREITVRAESGGKVVNITYDPHDAEAVKAAEVWRNALFADGAQFKAVAPVAVKGGDSVAFANPPRKETNGDKIRKADISVLSELLAAVKFGFWDSSYEIKSGVSVQHPEIFNRLNAYAGRIGEGT